MTSAELCGAISTHGCSINYHNMNRNIAYSVLTNYFFNFTCFVLIIVVVVSGLYLWRTCLHRSIRRWFWRCQKIVIYVSFFMFFVIFGVRWVMFCDSFRYLESLVSFIHWLWRRLRRYRTRRGVKYARRSWWTLNSDNSESGWSWHCVQQQGDRHSTKTMAQQRVSKKLKENLSSFHIDIEHATYIYASASAVCAYAKVSCCGVFLLLLLLLFLRFFGSVLLLLLW